jgi:anti-sigma factor RsiW
MMKDTSHSASERENELSARLLSALVDGELSEQEQGAMLARLHENPDDASRVAHYRAQNEALQALFPLPAATPTLFVQRRAPWWRSAVAGLGGMAAGVLLAVALYGSGWLGAGQPSFALRADMAYAVYAPEQRHPVEVGASEQQHLLAWLSRRLGHPLTAPSLQDYGYSLVGGRLLPGEAGPAAQFMYQSDKGERLTLYVTVFAKRELNPQAMRVDGRRTFYWANHGMGYALSGRSDEQALREMAQEACDELGGRAETWKG